jgi:hypothetical protein
LLKTGLLPEELRDRIVGLGHGDRETLHIMQEFSSLLVFAGLISLWFLRHYDQSWAFHWAMTAFWGLVALVHWFDVRGPVESVVGPAINSIPVILFVLLGVLRWRSEAGWSRVEKSAAAHQGKAC